MARRTYDRVNAVPDREVEAASERTGPPRVDCHQMLIERDTDWDPNAKSKTEGKRTQRSHAIGTYVVLRAL